MKNMLFGAMLLVTAAVSAQKVSVLAGDFQNLKGISEYNLTFDYDGLTVDRLSEEQYLANNMKKRASAGRDAEFKETWFADRQKRYEPKFVDSFNMRFKKGAVKANKGLASAKYTMNVKTTWIHPGFNVFVMHNGALLNMVVSVVETANPANVLLTVEYDKVGGKGIFTPIGFMDYNTGYRISEGYAKLAKTLAANMKKRIKA